MDIRSRSGGRSAPPDREKKARKAVRLRMPGGSRVKMHTHSEEESGHLVSGHIMLTIGGADYDMRTGDAWVIPAGVPHGARAIEDSVAIEITPAVRSGQA
jgi:quercetin dioxygenase-like cupin family protein